MIGAMAAVLATWCVLGAAMVGLGSIVLRAAGAGRSEHALSASAERWGSEEVLRSFWLGFAVVIAVLQAGHFFAPVSFMTELTLVAAGLAGLAWNGPAFAGAAGRALRSSVRGGSRGVVLACAVLAAWLANRALGAGDAHDSGLYHYAVMRWCNEFAVVPGLGNLSGPFALNNSSLLYAAMLDTGPWNGRANHIANGVLLLALGAQAVRGAGRLWRSARGVARAGAADVLDAVLLIPVVMLAVAEDVSSPKTDLPVGAVMMVCGAALLRWLRAGGAARRMDGAVFLAVMASAAVCIKLSAAGFALVVWAVAAAAWGAGCGDRRRAMRGLFVMAALSAALIGPWLARGVMLSGYPLFPSRALAMPVEWRVPERDMDELRHVISNHTKGELPMFLHKKVAQIKPIAWYAKLMKPPFDDRMEIKGWEWVRPWLFTLPVSSPIEVVMPAAIAAGAGAIGWRAGRRARAEHRHALNAAEGDGTRAFTLFFLPVAAGIVMWFLIAPGPRYIWPVMWLLAGGAAAWMFARGGCTSERGRKGLVALCVLGTLPALAFGGLRLYVIHKQNPLKHVPFVGPGPDHGFHPLPTIKLEQVRTNWGLEVWVPAKVDDNGRPQPLVLWDAPLPANAWPALNMNLRLRKEGDLGGGFVVEEWPQATGHRS